MRTGTQLGFKKVLDTIMNEDIHPEVNNTRSDSYHNFMDFTWNVDPKDLDLIEIEE